MGKVRKNVFLKSFSKDMSKKTATDFRTPILDCRESKKQKKQQLLGASVRLDGTIPSPILNSYTRAFFISGCDDQIIRDAFSLTERMLDKGSLPSGPTPKQETD